MFYLSIVPTHAGVDEYWLRRGSEFNFHKVSRQDEGPNSTFTKFPVKARVVCRDVGGYGGAFDWCRSRESARTLPRERAAVKICYVVGM